LRNGYTTAASLPAASPSASIDRGKRAGGRGRARNDGVQDDTVMAKMKIRATIVELCDDDMTTTTTRRHHDVNETRAKLDPSSGARIDIGGGQVVLSSGVFAYEQPIVPSGHRHFVN
jgi:hypothetical protein